MQLPPLEALVIDLNNFSRYPTLSVGYLVAVCRDAGMNVRVFSPLSVGVGGVVRERPETVLSLYTERLNFSVAQSRYRSLRMARAWIGENLRSSLSRHSRKVISAFEAELACKRPEIVLLSSYLMYRDLVESICAVCSNAGIPVLVGGPYFAQPEVVGEWVSIPGVTALAAGEVEAQLPEIIECVVAGNDPTVFEGMVVHEEGTTFRGSIARPFRELDTIPRPDFTDFPWHRYPNRIVPVLTGRGCAWGACTFCSDVTGTAGRTYRSRNPQLVLDEIRHQYETLGAKLFVFTDMKLNSDLGTWHTLIERMQDVAPGSRWIGSVHVNKRGDSGLGAAELRAAAAAGCVRLSTGLESGSQRMLNHMKKGVRLEEISQYLHDASFAGISTRTTMITGYPGETAKDVAASKRFVEEHQDVIERIKVCAFSLTIGTAIDRKLRKSNAISVDPAVRPSFNNSRDPGGPGRPTVAKIDYRTEETTTRAYRRETSRFLKAVHRVNRRPLPEHAAAFEGVM
jgi:anaerobic magnesium-protoporphyrin IX monomethyl ester cyclase